MKDTFTGSMIVSLREYKRHHRTANTPNTIQLPALIMSTTCPNRCINTPYDDFNKTYHGTNDGIGEDEVLKNISLIEKICIPLF